MVITPDFAEVEGETGPESGEKGPPRGSGDSAGNRDQGAHVDAVHGHFDGHRRSGVIVAADGHAHHAGPDGADGHDGPNAPSLDRPVIFDGAVHPPGEVVAEGIRAQHQLRAGPRAFTHR